ncbi:hypothetical protein RN22_00015 [Grimontia sp. AD028]|uniref:hypothetical protein n=1 Tax=Grimontia sp. AD028 TaxID=1581149 RepID=UPI00061B5954|nr:hypothetical protein [Grimontia sp. AD028]KKD62538.1 hypothetical protein RN22_00015 [Grimontia sp. AD028]
MNSQKGMATLAVVSGILLIVALFAVSVVNSGLADIKKTQNQILDAKQRASAKAGLDCAIAVFEQNGPTAISLSDGSFGTTISDSCREKTGSQIVLSGTESPWLLTSSSGYATYSAMVSGGGGTASAFKTSGSLVIEGGNSWVPAKGAHVGKEGQTNIYECLAIVAGGDVTIDTGDSNATFQSELLATNLEQCKEDFSTTVASKTRKMNDFESDILYQQPNMNLFKEKFQEPKSNWEKVRDDFDAVFSTSGTTTIDNGNGTETVKSNVELCGKTITDKRNRIVAGAGHSPGKLVTVWVDGDCNMAGVASDSVNPVFIVVKDGVIAYSGALANFNGSIFQFNHERNDFQNSWLDVSESTDDEGNKVTNVSCTSGPMATFCDLFNEPDALGMEVDNWKYLPFLFHGSFETKGSYIVDVEKGTSKVFGAFKPGYDESIDDDEFFPSEPKLVKGSIHDF